MGQAFDKPYKCRSLDGRRFKKSQRDSGRCGKNVPRPRHDEVVAMRSNRSVRMIEFALMTLVRDRARERRMITEVPVHNELDMPVLLHFVYVLRRR